MNEFKVAFPWSLVHPFLNVSLLSEYFSFFLMFFSSIWKFYLVLLSGIPSSLILILELDTYWNNIILLYS